MQTISTNRDFFYSLLHISEALNELAHDRLQMLSRILVSTPEKMKLAAKLVRKEKPDFPVDGDIQADAAVNSDILKRIFPFCDLKESANILIFPNLEASNISYKLLQQLGDVEVIGPFLLGVRGSVNILQRTSTVEGIINSVVLACLEAQRLKEKRKKHGYH